VRKFDERVLLRLSEGEQPISHVQGRVNRLHEMGAILALFSKLYLSRYWLIIRKSVPTLEIERTNSEIDHLRLWSESKLFSLRYHLPIFRDSLSRVLPLDERRIAKRGSSNAPIRNELNLRERQGYTVEKYRDEEAREICEEIFLDSQWRSWNKSARFPNNFEKTSLKVVVIRDSNSRVVTIDAAWVSGTFAENFYYCSQIKVESRLLAAESLIELCFDDGARFFRTDNLLDLFIDTYNFQSKLGYITCNIKWT